MGLVVVWIFFFIFFPWKMLLFYFSGKVGRRPNLFVCLFVWVVVVVVCWGYLVVGCYVRVF